MPITDQRKSHLEFAKPNRPPKFFQRPKRNNLTWRPKSSLDPVSARPGPPLVGPALTHSLLFQRLLRASSLPSLTQSLLLIRRPRLLFYIPVRSSLVHGVHHLIGFLSYEMGNGFPFWCRFFDHIWASFRTQSLFSRLGWGRWVVVGMLLGSR